MLSGIFIDGIPVFLNFLDCILTMFLTHAFSFFCSAILGLNLIPFYIILSFFILGLSYPGGSETGGA